MRKLSGVDDLAEDAARLRELAGKCRRVAAGLTDSKDVAALRQMAAEYETAANRIEHPRRSTPPLKF
jgi:hypothetical protein